MGGCRISYRKIVNNQMVKEADPQWVSPWKVVQAFVFKIESDVEVIYVDMS